MNAPPPSSVLSVAPVEKTDRLTRFAHEAMACTWGLYVLGEDSGYAKRAARAVFEEVDRIEQELSRFVEHSDVARINALTAGQSLRIGPEAFECLELAARICAETNGAFDVTVGGLLTGEPCGGGRPPASSQWVTGMRLLELDPTTRCVTVKAELVSSYRNGTDKRSSSVAPPSGGVVIDLGGIGKGYAIDRAVAILGDWSIESALIHAGQSTLYALGNPGRGTGLASRLAGPTGRAGWAVSIRNPQEQGAALAEVRLRDRAISGSGRLLHGPHIVDPRSQEPAAGPLAAWALASSGAVSDALSTAFMVLSPDEAATYCRRRPSVGGMQYIKRERFHELLRFGDET